MLVSLYDSYSQLTCIATIRNVDYLLHRCFAIQNIKFFVKVKSNSNAWLLRRVLLVVLLLTVAAVENTVLKLIYIFP